MAKKRETFGKYTIRCTPTNWEKLGWLAAECGATKQETLRRILATAVRGVKPPNPGETRAVYAERAEWDEWQKTADQLNTTVPKLVRRLMDQIGSRVD